MNNLNKQKYQILPIDTDSKEKGLEIKSSIAKILKKNKINLASLESESGDKFEFGQYKFEANSIGMFKVRNQWFYYRIDERGRKYIIGPFTTKGVIYTWALDQNQVVFDLLNDKYSFDPKDNDMLLKSHLFNSLTELKTKLKF